MNDLDPNSLLSASSEVYQTEFWRLELHEEWHKRQVMWASFHSIEWGERTVLIAYWAFRVTVGIICLLTGCILLFHRRFIKH